MDLNEEMARDAIREVLRSSERLAFARAEEMRLEDERCIAKRNATLRIMNGPDNPLTGKKHSASSAVEVVETDPEYLEYRKKQRQAVIDTECARGEFYAARYRAELAVATAREAAGI